MKEVKLPSGALLGLGDTPFSTSKALFQALMSEMKSIPVHAGMDLNGFFKDAIAYATTSPQVEACLWKCLERCTINGEKITTASFESAERRGDYLKVCAEVVKENVYPFVKNLFADFSEAVGKVTDFLASKQKTTT